MHLLRNPPIVNPGYAPGIYDGFCCSMKALTLVKPLSISLQLSSIDILICKAYQHVSETMQSVQHVCDNVDDFNSKWFDIGKNKSEVVGADGPTIPRRQRPG